MNILKIINRSFGSYEFRGITVEPTYWQAAAIIILIFLLVFTLARLRFIYVNWSLGKGSLSFLFYGFLLALIVEGFLLLSGKTIITEVLGWKNAPKPIGTALEAGRSKLINVLGAETEYGQNPNITIDTFMKGYENLSPNEKIKAGKLICKP